ncbi:unnamed protein product [Mytilus edulis]|uniref:Uncharacterized protein n=1 Tax=Mytilus edulis TaxID=6550 RepID=A0A8S3TLG5_MYTED|nr:unnamed protein product [Mytilus edulis]
MPMEKSIKSDSMRKAQVPVSCHVCNGPGAKRKCEELDVFMCRACKEKVHGKLKCSQGHEVATINDTQDTLVDSNEVPSEIINSVLNSYTTSVPTVSYLACSSDDIVYILYNVKLTECVFIKGKILKPSFKVLKSYPLPMFNFTLNMNDEVMFTNISYEKESPLRMISYSDEIRTVMDPNPMQITALHVNIYNELVIGLREQGPAFPVSELSVRRITIFGSDYQRQTNLEKDTKGRKMFTYPSFIRTDSENVLYVADMDTLDFTGRLLAVNRTERLKFSYRGPPSLGVFCPHSFAITPIDNIVLLDNLNNALHVLNPNGILLALQSLVKLNIVIASALCIDNERHLLIGCRGVDGQFGKIYVVKIADRFM